MRKSTSEYVALAGTKFEQQQDWRWLVFTIASKSKVPSHVLEFSARARQHASSARTLGAVHRQLLQPGFGQHSNGTPDCGKPQNFSNLKSSTFAKLSLDPFQLQKRNVPENPRPHEFIYSSRVLASQMLLCSDLPQHEDVWTSSPPARPQRAYTGKPFQSRKGWNLSAPWDCGSS